MSIDLEQLRQSAFSDSTVDAVVTRAFLRQVHAELTAARITEAQLNRVRTIDEVIHDLRMNPGEKAVRL